MMSIMLNLANSCGFCTPTSPAGSRKLARNAASSGFTMVEMVAVVLILSLLIAASSTAISGARKSALRAHSRETARQLAAAWTQYATDQGRFPDKSKFTGGEGSVFQANPDNIGKRLNTQYLSNGDPVPEKENIIYFEASEAEVKRVGSSLKTATYSGTGIIDRWKKPIYFTLDFYLDGQIDSPLGEGKINASALAFSTGGEEKFSDCISKAANNSAYRAKVPKSW